MDEILYLESDIEITQVIDKIKNLPGESVLLVLPKNAQLAQSIVNLRLIKKEAEKMGKAIALVTGDKNAINIASQVEIPIFKSIDASNPIKVNRQDLPQMDDNLTMSGHRSIAEELQVAGVNVRRYDDDDDIDEEENPNRPEDDKQIEKVKLTEREETVSEAKNKPSNKKEVSDKQKTKSKIPWIPIILGALSMTAVIWWLVYALPSASVFISQESEPLTKVSTITIDNNVSRTDHEAGVVTGRKIEAEIEWEVTVEATGEKEVGTKATGTLELRNPLGASVSLAAGTRFSSGGLIFVSTAAVTVPAGNLSASGDIVSGVAEVAVEAQNPGTQHNIAQSQFSTIATSGTPQGRITGVSKGAMTGGSSSTVTVISEDDIEEAKDKIAQEAQSELEEKLKEQARNLTILAGTIEVIVEDITANHEVGTEAESITVKANARGRTISFLAGEYQETIFALARIDLPEGKELVIDQTDSIETSISERDIGQGILTLRATLNTEIVDKIDQEQIKESVAGLRIGEAHNLIEENDGIVNVRIELRPSYKNSLPKSTKKIEVILVRE